MRSTTGLVVYGIICDTPRSIIRVPRITIDVKVGEAAAININTNTMAWFELVSRRFQWKLEPIHLSVFH